MSTFIGMGVNKVNNTKTETNQIKELKKKIATLEKEVETERLAKEEALTKIATLEKEVDELNKKNK